MRGQPIGWSPTGSTTMLERAVQQISWRLTEIANTKTDPRVVRLDGTEAIQRARDRQSDRPNLVVRSVQGCLDAVAGQAARLIRLNASLVERGTRVQMVTAAGRTAEPAWSCYIRGLDAIVDEHRMLDRVPVSSLLIWDDRVALAPLPCIPPSQSALLVSDSGLVRPLAEIFAAVWERAETFRTDLDNPSPGLSMTSRQRRIVDLLGNGYTDEMIARALRITDRTVRREVARLCAMFGAETRFQLGLEVARLHAG